MAFKCIRTCYPGRLFEEGVVYDSIGEGDQAQFFVEVDGEGAQVVETGDIDSDVDDAPGQDAPDVDAAKQERAEIKEALKELDVEFNPRVGTDKLKELLLDAQKSALSS